MLIIGHRGSPGTSPENTLKSFEETVLSGADALEFDVQICKTGELVVIHDMRVDRTTDGKGLVSQLTFSELRGLDAGIPSPLLNFLQSIHSAEFLFLIVPQTLLSACHIGHQMHRRYIEGISTPKQHVYT